MPNLLATASQVANSLSNLKAKYIKYLESLCTANGIDISTLKTTCDAHTILEMYFGGLPVLVGLKYFTHLSTLRLFGQSITCLKPLAEIAPSLEELWVCEGSIKDLSGVEHCVRLKKLFLYQNSIEDARCLASLTLLQQLDLSSNKLKHLSFIKWMKDLTNLSLADNKMKDSIMNFVSWPGNIQHLDISANLFSSNKVFFPLTMLSSLRSLHSHPIYSETNVSTNLFFTWIAHSFRFIELIDDDPISDQFVPTFRPMVDTVLAERTGKCAKIDEKYLKDVRMAEKHSAKIENRLGCLSDALAFSRDMMQSKDAKKEIVKRVYEICLMNSKGVKNIKKNYILLSEYIRTLGKYKIACDLESCQTFQLRDADEDEVALIGQTLNFNCSMKNCYEIVIKSCEMVCDVSKNDAERLFILEKNSNDSLFDIRSMIQLLDKYSRKNYIKSSVKLVRDFEVIKKQAKEKLVIFFLPLVLSKMSTTKGAARIMDEEGISLTSNDNLSWSDVRLVAVLAVEAHPIGHLSTDQIRFMDKFEESFTEQLRKLNEMNIKLDIKEERQKKLVEETTDASIENMSNPQAKLKKVSDVLMNPSNLNGRICCEALPFEWFSTRNSLEISLAYFDGNIEMKDASDLAMKITSLDLSEMKLTKLAGIQELVSLQFLSVRKNKLCSLKKLMRLPTLKLLDASSNHIAKLEQLPSTLLYADLSTNRIQNLTFCQNLASIRDLKLQKNHIKSLKGLENCVQLENLQLNENLVKDKIELDIFKSLTKLIHLDISGNPISAVDGIRSKLMQFSPFLISIDKQLIPVEERQVNTSKQTTRGLSLELIEKISPEWKNKRELMISDHKIEQIILEKSQLEELEHVRLINLSKNKLSSVKEISSLSITNLILNENCIKCIAVAEGTLKPFQLLENLELVNNSINNSTIVRLGISMLLKLKSLNLSSNNLTKFDCSIFELPCLEFLGLSNNYLKTIIRKSIKSLTNLNLQNNRLTTLSPMSFPNLINLNVSNNKLASCASLKPLCESKCLEILDCRNNSVTERRVYVDFIRSQVPSVKKLDDEPMCSEIDTTKRRLSRANELVAINRRNSMTTSSMLSWFENQEEEVLDNVPRATSFLDIPKESANFVPRPRKLEPIRGRISLGDDNDSCFMLFGKKAVQHKKL